MFVFDIVGFTLKKGHMCIWGEGALGIYLEAKGAPGSKSLGKH